MQLSNKNILKKLLPFLVMFVMTLSYAGFQVFQDVAGGASAAQDNYVITLNPIETPYATDSEWKWNMAIFANSTINKTPSIDYSVNWCGATSGKVGIITETECDPKNTSTFVNTLNSGTINIKAKETITKFEHQSINCGKAEITMTVEGNLVNTTIFDTGKRCSNAFGGSTTGVAPNPDDIEVVLYEAWSKMICAISGCNGKPPTHSGSAPATETPIPLPPGSPSGSIQVPDSAAQNVVNLAKHIEINCSGRVTGANAGCMDGLNIGSVDDRLTTIKIKGSAIAFSDYGGLQCVGFAKASQAAAYGINDNYFGNAYSYSNSKKDPYVFEGIRAPRVNDLAVWTGTGISCGGKDCGHIAYVTQTLGGNKFYIADANRRCLGCVGLHQKVYTTDDRGFAGFLSRK